MNLENALIKMQRLLNKAWQAHAEEAGVVLSQNEFEYLACIFAAEKVQPPEDPQQHDDSAHLSSVAQQMQVRKSSASLMINKLEKRGFIQRLTCRYDARAQHILLTEQGREVFLSIREQVYGAMASKVKKCLGKKDTSKLKSIAEKLD